MALKYKIDLVSALKEKGYSAYRIRKDNLFGQKTCKISETEMSCCPLTVWTNFVDYWNVSPVICWSMFPMKPRQRKNDYFFCW